MKTRKNNKGFSLVELIVVVAIMAVLVGVLAPAYLKYVESSREKKDLNNLEEVRHAVEVALAEEKVFDEADDAETVTVKADGTIQVAGNTELEAALKSTIGSDLSVSLVSKKLAKDQIITINITNDGTDSVTAPNNGNWNS